MALVFEAVYFARHEAWDDFNLIAANGDNLFHYSVRPAQRQIVFNRTHDGVWAEQTEFDFDPDAAPVQRFTTIIEGLRAWFLIDGTLCHEVVLDSEAAEATVRSSMIWRRDDQILDGGLLRVDHLGTDHLGGFVVRPAKPAGKGRKRKEPPPARQVFRGWMFASSPALSALEHPVYDIGVVDCVDSSARTSPGETPP